MITILLLFLTAWVILDTLEDYGYITGKSKLWHSADAASRALIFGYVIYLNFGLSILSFSILSFVLSMYWIVFDYSLNKKRKLPSLYVGSGSIDLFVKKIAKIIKFDHEVLMLIIKLITLIMSIIGIIVYF